MWGNGAPFNIAQATNSTFRSFSTTGVSTFKWWNRGFFTPNSAGAKLVMGSDNFPADLARGAEIGPGREFGKGHEYGLLFTYGKGVFSFRGGGTKSNHRGHMSLAQDSYIGFEFSQAGSVHYGWARLGVSFTGNTRKRTRIYVRAYGYEPTPNTAIAAGTCGAEQQSNNKPPADSPANLEKTSLGMWALSSAEAAAR